MTDWLWDGFSLTLFSTMASSTWFRKPRTPITMFFIGRISIPRSEPMPLSGCRLGLGSWPFRPATSLSEAIRVPPTDLADGAWKLVPMLP